MGASEPTPAEVGHDLAVFSNYRVRRAQQLVIVNASPVDASKLMALGLREDGLRNKCGGAKFVNGKWVESFTDRGWTQISDQIPENLAWLKTVPGCPDGLWVVQPGHTAAEPMYNPRFTDATIFTIDEMKRNHALAERNGVDAAHIVRFCIAAHNAGFSGALDGYRKGNVDLHTALGDYSAWVLKYASIIHQWVVNHPAWVWHVGEPL